MAKINKEKQAAMPQKLLHELFDYDGLTGEWTNKTNRNSRARKGQPTGYLDKITGYVRIKINGYGYRAHRLAWTYIYGDYPKGEQLLIDHINGNPSDNRIENLRISSHSENQRNQKISSRNMSGCIGVHRCEKTFHLGKTYAYWKATWRDENGKGREKNFNISKLGEEGAKQMAITHRAEQIRLLEQNHGIVYSDRHGK